MKSALPAALAAIFTLTACAGGGPEDTAAGAIFGGATGAIAATALGGDSHDRWLAGLAGAGIGAALSANQRRGATPSTCVYSDGRGGTYRAAC